MSKITATSWPQTLVKSVDCRKRDIVIRIADWTRDREEPAFDVECYVGGVYDWNKSKAFTTRNAGKTRKQARAEAVAFASEAIARFLK